MTTLRSRCTLALALLLTSALLVVPGGKHLLICIEADGRIHVESGTEPCCDTGAPSTETGASVAAPTGSGDCGSCRDVLAGSAPARQTASGSVPPPGFQICHAPDAGPDDDSTPLGLPASDPPSLILASLQTIVIRC